MKFKIFTGTDADCDEIYNNAAYDDQFFIETKYGERLKVSLVWEQGRTNNYRFVRGCGFRYAEADVIFPGIVTKIQEL